MLDAIDALLGAHIFPPRADGSDPRVCPTCGTGRLSLKLGKFGSFIGCSNYPECRYTRQMQASGAEGDGAEGPSGDQTRVLGTDPATGLEVTLRAGRFGPYVQLGEGDKPKRSSLPKTWSPQAMDLGKALALLSLPREVGLHPETGKPITAGLGRFGPFVLHDGTYANLPSPDEVFEIGLNRAVTLIAEKQAGGRGRGRGTPAALKDFGEHASLGAGAITVRDGKYGPYVNHGKVNATLPKGMTAEQVTLEVALALLAEKAAKGPAKPARGGSRATAKAGAEKAPAAAKTTAKAAAPAKKKAADATAEAPAKPVKAKATRKS